MTHRFINADSYASTGQGFIGTNMFAYCLSNPVNFSDTGGNFPDGTIAISETWSLSMWWLSFVDGPWPIGEIVYSVVLVALIFVDISSASQTIDTIHSSVEKEEEANEQESEKTKSVGKKKKKTRKSGKEKANDKLSWVDPRQIDLNLSPQKNASILLNQKYGVGNWNKGPGSEYNQICKWIARSLLASAVLDATVSDRKVVGGGLICTTK